MPAPRRPAAPLLIAAPLLLAALLLAPAPARASDAASPDSLTALARKVQNPIGELTTLPFQANVNPGTGPHKGTQVTLNIQPVIPIHLSSEWNIITRTILPLTWMPSMQPAASGATQAQSVPFGTAPVTFSALLSRRQAEDGWKWGIGPVIQVPTASNARLGSSVWGAGPGAVAVRVAGPWVTGAVVNTVWSLGGRNGPTGKPAGGTRYATFTLQPLVNYNFGEGWYVAVSPIVTANWLAAGRDAWTIPIGGGPGRVMRLGGGLPLNLQVAAYWNAVRPQSTAPWQFRAQATLIF